MPDRDFVDIARDDAVHQFGGVLACDQVLVQRRDIDQRASIADRVVLVLMMYLVYADGVISRPFPVVQAVAEGESSIVKSGSDGQGSLALTLGFPREPLWISGVAPGIPERRIICSCAALEQAPNCPDRESAMARKYRDKKIVSR